LFSFAPVKMKKILLSLICAGTIMFFGACSSSGPEGADVKIETDEGDIFIKLYDDTPIHKANFLKLAEQGYYDGTTFHRIVNEFMIQGGDPYSKDPSKIDSLGSGGPDSTLDAEIKAEHLHKRGALCAARKGGMNELAKRSSGSQFYIVTGKKYTAEELAEVEKRVQSNEMSNFMGNYLKRPENQWLKTVDVPRLQKENPDSLRRIDEKIRKEMDEERKAVKPFTYPEDIKKIYMEQGGAPQLDLGYTVFGEVLQGMEVVDKISAAELDPQYPEKPKDMVKMKVIVLKK